MNILQQKIDSPWNNGNAKEFTFIVTKDCQLACKYCYLVGKNSSEKMSFEIAKGTVDYILSNRYDSFFNTKSVIFNFIGGEPFLEIDLIDKICDYIKRQMYILKHHWFNSYRFSISTNGINYDSERVQKFIRKNKYHLSIGITIDGTRLKHDMNRIWRSNENIEKGSYKDVVRNVPLWLQQFPNAGTKVTISSPDVPYICESVLHLYSLGIKTISINCVFEGVWKEGDDVVFEKQLLKLADEIIDKDLYLHNSCSLFDETIGKPMDSGRNTKNWCGSGLMLAIDSSGNFYPCTRFVQYSLRNKKARIVGNIYDGLDKNKIRPFLMLDRCIQSTKECIECPVASGCAWCQGENYDCSSTNTIFERSTAICNMHKARVRANEYYWRKLYSKQNICRESKELVDNRCKLDKSPFNLKSINVLLDSSAVQFCNCPKSDKEYEILPLDSLKKVISFAKDNDYSLRFIHSKKLLPQEYYDCLFEVPHITIVPYGILIDGETVVVFSNLQGLSPLQLESKSVIFRISKEDFFINYKLLAHFMSICLRVDIKFSDGDFFNKEDLTKYERCLLWLKDMIKLEWQQGHQIHMNILTDSILNKDSLNCNAGVDSLTLAPNGKFYVCPAFYHQNVENACGSLIEGIHLFNHNLYKKNHSLACRNCNINHCSRCIYENINYTQEVNTPSYEQCAKARMEYKYSIKLYNELKDFYEDFIR